MTDNHASFEAPAGAHFEWSEVKTAHNSLGNVPLLVWDDLEAARQHYGDEGIIAILDGTSIRVAVQAIARRNKIAGKADEDIAKLQIDYRPGKRVVGASTPASRARSAAARAVDKLGDQGDLLTEILRKIEAGEITADELSVLNN